MHTPVEGESSQLCPNQASLSPSSFTIVHPADLQCNTSTLTILYYNARSLLPKHSELQLIAEAYSPSVICITETWLGDNVLDCELPIPNYHIVRFDRNRNGGGVLMFISDDFTYYVLPNCNGLELLTVVVNKESTRACISLFYRPPSSSAHILDTLCTYLESLSVPQFSNFVLLGDFNINFCTQSNSTLFTKLESFFALQQVVTEPTHVHHNGTSSLIDLVFVSNLALFRSCHVIPSLGNSDHNGVIVHCKWRPTAQCSCTTTSRSHAVWHYKRADWERASTLIENVNWNSVLSDDDVNESWTNWCQQFLAIMEVCMYS